MFGTENRRLPEPSSKSFPHRTCSVQARGALLHAADSDNMRVHLPRCLTTARQAKKCATAPSDNNGNLNFIREAPRVPSFPLRHADADKAPYTLQKPCTKKQSQICTSSIRKWACSTLISLRLLPGTHIFHQHFANPKVCQHSIRLGLQRHELHDPQKPKFPMGPESKLRKYCHQIPIISNHHC